MLMTELILVSCFTDTSFLLLGSATSTFGVRQRGEISSSPRNAPMPPRVELCTGDGSTMLFKSFLELHDCLHAKDPHICLVRLKKHKCLSLSCTGTRGATTS